MKVFILVLALAVYISEAQIKCIQGTDGTAAATNCAEASETKCSGPKFVQYTGFSADIQYKCGGCAVGTEATCEDCTGDACHKPAVTGEDFKCKNWEFKEEKWGVMEAVTTCKRLKDTVIMCNKPGAKADKNTVVSAGGCGPCQGTSVKDETCAECDTAECNSGAAALLGLLLPLVAALYALL